MDTVPETRVRKSSVSTKDSSEHAGPQLSQAHRRMSRFEPPPPGQLGGSHRDRRVSMYRRPSIAGSQRTDESNKPAIPVKLQNTYRMAPNEEGRFNVGSVEKALQSILEAFLEGEEYEAKKCAAMAQNLSDHIKSRVKEMRFPRYKIVCSVLIGQNCGQSMEAVSRGVWNAATDSFASATYKNSSILASAVVFATYFE